MAEKKFSKKEAISFGWKATKKNLLFFICFLISTLVILGILQWIQNSEECSMYTIIFCFAISILVWLAEILVSMMTIKTGLRLCDAEKITVADIFKLSWSAVFNYIIASFLYGLIVVAGTILLIVPGIIWAIKYGFYGYLILDKGMGPIAAIKRSGAITKGSIWNLYLLFLLIALINMAGALAVLLGLFISIPITIIANAYVYRKLEEADAIMPAEPRGSVPSEPAPEV